MFFYCEALKLLYTTCFTHTWIRALFSTSQCFLLNIHTHSYSNEPVRNTSRSFDTQTEFRDWTAKPPISRWLALSAELEPALMFLFLYLPFYFKRQPLVIILFFLSFVPFNFLISIQVHLFFTNCPSLCIYPHLFVHLVWTPFLFCAHRPSVPLLHI